MGDVIRSEPGCYYVTPEYAQSFWGKYVYIYSGKGKLTLTTEALTLRGGALDLEIPLKSIKSVGLGVFSSWSKPTGLAHLVVNYHRDDDWVETIYLVPATSPLATTWSTSRVVADWFATMGHVDALKGRLEPVPMGLPTSPTFPRVALLLAIVGLPALISFLLIMALAARRVDLLPATPQAAYRIVEAKPAVATAAIHEPRGRDDGTAGAGAGREDDPQAGDRHGDDGGVAGRGRDVGDGGR